MHILTLLGCNTKMCNVKFLVFPIQHTSMCLQSSVWFMHASFEMLWSILIHSLTCRGSLPNCMLGVGDNAHIGIDPERSEIISLWKYFLMN